MKVLLVDDNELNLEIQRYMLESCGLEVDTADSGITAVTMVKNNSYSLIFMDIQMPGMDGFTAASQIRKNGGAMPIIALSADKISYDDERFIAGGMNDSIKKPLRQNDLHTLLSGYLDLSGKTGKKTGDGVLFDSESFSALIPKTSAAVQILEQFLNVHGSDCITLKERIRTGNILGAREIMYDIVGISGDLYCGRLNKAANALGAELRQGRFDSLDKFTEVWELTVADLRSYCDSLVPEEETAEENIGWDVLWSDFIELCSIFDISAVKLFKRNMTVFAENLSEDQFQKIKNAALRYDFLAIIT